MNRYTVTLQTNDTRIFEVVIKADGFSENCNRVMFWRRSWMGILRRNVHYIAKSVLVSVLTKAENE